MSRYRNALAGQREAIRALWGAVGRGARVRPDPRRRLDDGAEFSLRIHIPPDLSAGATVRPDAPAPPHIYTRSRSTSGSSSTAGRTTARASTGRSSTRWSNFLTPACRQDRLDDHAERNARRELAGRQRAVWEIPGRGYAVERVYDEGGGSWVVSLDLMIEETVLGERVKSRAVAYPVRVVRYDVDRELNPWGLALDCLAGVPRAIELEETP